MECQAIMPGPPMPEDCGNDLLRPSSANLRNPAWWAGLGAQGVVFYGWGLSKYLPVVRAIRQAGLKLVCNMDTVGSLGVLTGPWAYWRYLWIYNNGLGVSSRSLGIFVTRLLASVSWSLLAKDMGRARYFRHAHLIGAVSPLAEDRLRRLCRFYGGRSLAARVHLIPHPVAPYMRYQGEAKKPVVVAIGRWLPEDWPQKDPEMLWKILARVLAESPHAEARILGRMDSALQSRFVSLGNRHPGRVQVMGYQPNNTLAPLLAASQVLLCSSLYESFHIASAEALCCGCSVVGPATPELPSLHWFVRENSGTLAARTPDALGGATLHELAQWRAGHRHAQTISSRWSTRLHAAKVARRILDLLAGASGVPSGGNQSAITEF